MYILAPGNKLHSSFLGAYLQDRRQEPWAIDTVPFTRAGVRVMTG